MYSVLAKMGCYKWQPFFHISKHREKRE